MRVTWVGARSDYSVAIVCAVLILFAVSAAATLRADNDIDSAAASSAAASVDEAAPTEEAVDADVAQLIEQLDADRFAQRQAATQKLLEKGKSVIPALIEAAGSESREVSGRAVEILKRHVATGDEEMKTAAKEALDKIAAGDNAAAAARAREALTPPEEAAPAGRNFQIAPGRLRIQVRALGGQGARRIRVSNVNGVKDIEVHDGERSVKIHDDPAKGIKMEVTQKKDGKEVTEKFEAKDADDLKKNHPQAHKIYEEFSRGNGGIQIRAVPVPGGVPLPRGVPIPGGAPMPVPGGAPAVPGAALPPGVIPPGAIPPGALPADGAANLREFFRKADEARRDAVLDLLQKRIDELERQAKAMGEEAADDKKLSEIVKHLKEARRQYEAQPLHGLPQPEGDAAP